MKKSLIFFAFVAITSLTLNVRADFVTSSTAGVGWQSWDSSVLGTSGKPYWNRSSFDGADYNIGHYMTKTGAFVVGNGPGVALPFWGKTFVSGSATDTGAADKNFWMTKDGIDHSILYLEKVAANKNIFGWFETDSAGSVLGAKHVLFDGNVVSPVSGPVNFAPTAYNGFYLEGPSGSFHSLSGFNSPDDNLQHFTIFKEDDFTFWIGVEDLKKSSSDKDYNDMIFKFTFSEGKTPPGGDQTGVVPEPTTMSLMLIGLAGIGAFAWTRRNRRDESAE
jgi:hypothetical protein